MSLIRDKLLRAPQLKTSGRRDLNCSEDWLGRAYQNSVSECSADPAAVAAAAGPASSSDEERTTGLEVRGPGWVHMGRENRKGMTFSFGERTAPKVEGATPCVYSVHTSGVAP